MNSPKVAPQPVPFSDTLSELFASPALTKEEQIRVAERMKEIDLLLKEQKKAKYKLEVTFNRQRSNHRPFPGVITWWENANKLHGGGDAKLYMCPSKDRGKGVCEAVIPDSANGTGFIVCPTCGHVWKASEVFGEVFYNLTVQKWAEVLLSWFRKLDLDADIRIKFARDDIRHIARLEQDKQRGGELLLKARDEDRRTTSIYKLVRIIQDTSSGADLYKRLYAFLSA
jgi:hypothetical protein